MNLNVAVISSEIGDGQAWASYQATLQAALAELDSRHVLEAKGFGDLDAGMRFLHSTRESVDLVIIDGTLGLPEDQQRIGYRRLAAHARECTGAPMVMLRGSAAEFIEDLRKSQTVRVVSDDFEAAFQTVVRQLEFSC